jgi:hypothetical protein
MYLLSSPRATAPNTAVSFALGAVSALAVVALSALLWTLHTPREFAVVLPAANASTDTGSTLRAPPATVPNELDEPPEELPPTF